MSSFVHIFLQNKHMVPKVYALSRSDLGALTIKCIKDQVMTHVVVITKYINKHSICKAVYFKWNNKRTY